jgi:DNA replication protein DnaC
MAPRELVLDLADKGDVCEHCGQTRDSLCNGGFVGEDRMTACPGLMAYYERTRRAARAKEYSALFPVERRYRNADIGNIPSFVPMAHIQAYDQLQSSGRRIVATVKAEQSDSPTFLFVGTYGSGKTYLACAICNALLRDGYSAAFCPVSDTLQRLKAYWSRTDYDAIDLQESSEALLIEAMKEVSLLVLDDYGTQGSNSAWSAERIYMILNARYNAGRATLITTNMDRQRFASYGGEYGARIASRCGERNGGYIFEFPSVDLRFHKPKRTP